MRKAVSLVVSMAIVVCVMVLGPRTVAAQENLAKFVPEDAVFFKTSVDVEKAWASIVASNFWKQVTSLSVWDKAGVRAGLQDVARGFSEEVGFELSTENIMSLLGKEIAMAVCVQPGETPKIQGFVLCRSNPKATAETIVGKFTDFIKKQAGEEAEFKDTVYKDTKITSVTSAEAPIQVEFGFIGDVLAVGIGNTPPGLSKIVDLAGGSGNSLAGNARFKKILDATKMAGGRYAGCGYVDLQKVGQILEAMDVSGFPAPVQPMMQGLKQSLSMPVVLGGTSYIDRGVVTRMASLPAGDLTDELIKLSLGTAPAAGTNIRYIPENAIVYVGVNNMPDVEKMWPLLLKQWEKQGTMPVMNMIFGQIETALGIKIADDVIPWVGNEFGVLFSDIDTKAGFPYPKFAFMLKIKDKQKAGAFVQHLSGLIQELSTQSGFKFEKFVHQSCELSSVTIALPMPVPMTFTPSYGIVEDFLIIGSSADLAKQMIDTSKGAGNDVASNAAFKSMNIPAQTNSTFFVNSARFMDVVKAVGAWVVEFTKAQPMLAESAKNAVENYVVPIANCLSALDCIGGYQINDGTMSAATYIIRVKDLPAR